MGITDGLYKNIFKMKNKDTQDEVFNNILSVELINITNYKRTLDIIKNEYNHDTNDNLYSLMYLYFEIVVSYNNIYELLIFLSSNKTDYLIDIDSDSYNVSIFIKTTLYELPSMIRKPSRIAMLIKREILVLEQEYLDFINRKLELIDRLENNFSLVSYDKLDPSMLIYLNKINPENDSDYITNRDDVTIRAFEMNNRLLFNDKIINKYGKDNVYAYIAIPIMIISDNYIPTYKHQGNIAFISYSCDGQSDIYKYTSLLDIIELLDIHPAIEEVLNTFFKVSDYNNIISNNRWGNPDLIDEFDIDDIEE